jgi:hypothetical protein
MRKRGRVVWSLSLGVALALVMAVPQAVATPIEVKQPNGQHCVPLGFSGDTVSGGCVTHLVGTNNNINQQVEFGAWLFGSPVTLHFCDMEMTLRMDEDGNAAISDVTMTNCNGTTTVRACTSSEAHTAAPNNGEVPWRSATAAEETSPGEATLPIAICFKAMTTTGVIDCEGVVSFMVDTTSVPYGLSTDYTGVMNPNYRCFMDGIWLPEAAAPGP